MLGLPRRFPFAANNFAKHGWDFSVKQSSAVDFRIPSTHNRSFSMLGHGKIAGKNGMDDKRNHGFYSRNKNRLHVAEALEASLTWFFDVNRGASSTGDLDK